jgi:hypothetical protein
MPEDAQQQKKPAAGSRISLDVWAVAISLLAAALIRFHLFPSVKW